MKLWVAALALQSFVSATVGAAYASSLKSICPGGIKHQNELIEVVRETKEVGEDGYITESKETKITNTTGKCFNITDAEFVYYIDKNHAIYRILTDDYSNPLMYFDFGGSRVKDEMFAGTIKGVGKYTIRDGRGIPRKIPRMVVVGRPLGG